MFKADYFDEFMSKVNHSDLSRRNLFVVKFNELLTVIFKDTVISSGGFIKPDRNGISTNTTNYRLLFGDTYSWNDLDIRLNQHEVADRLLGATNSHYVKQLFGGDFFDNGQPNKSLNRDVSLMVKSVSLPSSSLETTSNKSDKLIWNQINGRTVGDMTMTLYCSPNQIERKLIMNWMDYIHNQFKNTYAFHDEYVKDINVYQLGRDGYPAANNICYGCFPKSVSPAVLDADDSGIFTFDVTFSVRAMRLVPLLGNEIRSALSRVM